MAILRLAGSLLMAMATTLFGAESIAEVDFKDFDYPWEQQQVGVPETWQWLAGEPSLNLRIVNGRHDFSPEESFYSGNIAMQSVAYGDLTGDGIDEAAVDLLLRTGGTANWHYLYVFTLRNGSPELLGRLRSGSRADGGLANITIEQNALVLDFADRERRVGDCCSEGYVRVTYRWDSDRFVEAGPPPFGDVELGLH